MHRDELAHVSERFDIHVMAFADDSDATALALTDIFGIDSQSARALIAEAPVVVKRGADPGVADSLLDALGKLGAQVVILPSQYRQAPAAEESGMKAAASASAPADDSDASDGGDGEFDFFAQDGERHEEAASPARPAWGGLDMAAARAPAPAPSATLTVDRRAVESQPPSVQGSPARRTSLVPLPSRPPAPRSVAPRPAPMAVFEEQAPDHARDGRREHPAVHQSEPSGPPSEPPPEELSLELAVPIPQRRAAAPTLHEARPAPPPARHSIPPPVPAAARTMVAEPGPDLGLGSVPPLPSLGLGSVPPLPSLSALSTPPRAWSLPPPVPRDASRGRGEPLLSEHPRAQPAQKSGSVQLPRAKASAPRAGRGDPALAPPVPRDGWVTRSEVPAAPDLPRIAATAAAPVSAAAASAVTSTPSPVEEARPRPRPKAAPEPAPRVNARGLALVELLGGVAVFAVGLWLGNSVLQGNATTVSFVVHGFGLYAIGAGVAGLRP